MQYIDSRFKSPNRQRMREMNIYQKLSYSKPASHEEQEDYDYRNLKGAHRNIKRAEKEVTRLTQRIRGRLGIGSK